MSAIAKLGDRLLNRLVPQHRAQANNCVCTCMDKCFYVCWEKVDGEYVQVPHPERGCTG